MKELNNIWHIVLKNINNIDKVIENIISRNVNYNVKHDIWDNFNNIDNIIENIIRNNVKNNEINQPIFNKVKNKNIKEII